VSEMIERVGDAMFAALVPGEEPVEREHACWNTMARAAIAAMREPDEAMTDQIIFAEWCPDIPSGSDLYTAMIDAALRPDGG
jgi:hypothetical protein